VWSTGGGGGGGEEEEEDLFVFNDTIEEVHRRRNTPVRRCLPNPRTELSPCTYIIQFYFFPISFSFISFK